MSEEEPGQLWAGRFSKPPALGGRGARPLARGGRAARLRGRAGRDRARGGASRRRAGDRRRTGASRRRVGGGTRRRPARDVRVRPARRGHPLGDRARRDGPARRPRREAACGALPQRPRRDRCSAVSARGIGNDHGGSSRAGPDACRACPGARGGPDAGLDPRASCAARDRRATICAHTRGRLSRDLGRFADWRATVVGIAPRRGRAGHLDARTRRGRDGRAPRVRPSVRELDRRGQRPRRLAGVHRGLVDLRDAPVAAGRRSRAVDRSRARLGRAGRGLLDRVEHDAPEAEPGYRRAVPREGRPDRG